MVGLPNSVGNQGEKEGDIYENTHTHREREMWENSKIKTNHTLFLFSLLLRLKLNYVAFSVFAASEILSTPFKSKKKEREKKNQI